MIAARIEKVEPTPNEPDDAVWTLLSKRRLPKIIVRSCGS